MSAEAPPTLADRLRRTDGIVCRTMDGGAMLVDLDSGRVWRLNRTGVELWELLDGERTLGNVAFAVTNRYQIDSERVADDVIDIATTLMQHGLVQR